MTARISSTCDKILLATIVNRAVIVHSTLVRWCNFSRGESRRQYFIGEPGHHGYTSSERLEFRAGRPRRAQNSGIEFTIACRMRIQQLNNISGMLFSLPFCA